MEKAKVKLAEQKSIAPIRTEESIQTRLQLLKHTSEVQSRIKGDITSDFTLARLSDEDKQSIIEMTDNAYYVKKLMQKLKEFKKPTWKEGKWKMEPLEPQEKQYIQALADTSFDAYMIRIYMTVLLNRNIENNILLRYLAQKATEEEEQEEERPREKETLLNKIKEIAKKRPSE